MLSIFYITATAALFALGYYLGHQIGSTRHIREHLAEVRAKNNQ